MGGDTFLAPNDILLLVCFGRALILLTLRCVSLSIFIFILSHYLLALELKLKSIVALLL